jgi:trans-aconitate methyltransferase
MTEHTGASYEGISRQVRRNSRYQNVERVLRTASSDITAAIPPANRQGGVDVGCGSGKYAEFLLSRGAVITAHKISSLNFEYA